MGLIPDTSVLVYYMYGISSQRNNIIKIFNEFENDVIINQILLLEIGRVIFKPLYYLKSLITEILNLETTTSLEDFWINLDQKILKLKKPQLLNGLISIITNIRNHFQNFPIQKSDPKYYEKMIDRIFIAVNLVEEELFNFQEELTNWTVSEEYNCPQSQWKLVKSDDFEFKYGSRCSLICSDRDSKIHNITKKFYKVFVNIKEKGEKFCKDNNINLDKRMYKAINKMLEGYESQEKLKFWTNYCYSLGDFLISTLLLKSSHTLYTYNTKDFKFLSNFLDFNFNRIKIFQPDQV